MIKQIGDFWYYLCHGETKEESDKRRANEAIEKAKAEKARKEIEAQWEAYYKAAAKEREIERKAEEKRKKLEEAKQKKLENERAALGKKHQDFINDINRLSEEEMRNQRRRALRMAKEIQDGLSD